MEWRPISEAPDDDGYYLLLCSVSGTVVGYRSCGAWTIKDADWPDDDAHPTHFAFLPLPPTGEDG